MSCEPAPYGSAPPKSDKEIVDFLQGSTYDLDNGSKAVFGQSSYRREDCTVYHDLLPTIEHETFDKYEDDLDKINQAHRENAIKHLKHIPDLINVALLFAGIKVRIMGSIEVELVLKQPTISGFYYTSGSFILKYYIPKIYIKKRE